MGVASLGGRGSGARGRADGWDRRHHRAPGSGAVPDRGAVAAADIATLVDGRIERRRAEGKLDRLVQRLAAAKGTDVDQPRNLAKSVTVE